MNITRKEETSPIKPPRGRKRKRNVNLWKTSVRKHRRNKGKKYTTPVKKIEVNGRSLGEPCGYPKRCWNLVSEAAEEVFHSFWNLGDFQAQNNYLMQNIKLYPKKKEYTKEKNSRRQFSFRYEVKVNNVFVVVCKRMFLAIHGLQKSRGRLANIQKQIKAGNTVAMPDGRGKHSNRPNKYSDAHINGVHRFLQEIPKYQSHYSRRSNPNKTFLDADLNITSLYNKVYKDWCRSTQQDTFCLVRQVPTHLQL